MSSMFKFRYLQEGGGPRVKVLHPESYLTVVDYNQKESVAARTDAGRLGLLHRLDPAVADPETVWIIEQITPDPEYLSGFATKAVAFISDPNSTEVKAERTPWMCLSWFVPVGAEFQE